MNVCFCGIDGVGKSYYIKKINDIMNQNGEKNYIYNPMKNGKNIATLCDNIPQLKSIYNIYDATLISMVYALDLYYSMKKMNDNSINLIHRGAISCKIYAKMRGADVNVINSICNMIPYPDLTIFMSINPEIAFERIVKRSISGRSWKEEYTNLRIADKYFNDYYEVERLKHNCIRINCDNSNDENVEIILRAINKIKE